MKVIEGAAVRHLNEAGRRVGVFVDFHGYPKPPANRASDVPPFGLKTMGGKKVDGKHPKYRKVGRGGATVPGRVCWHGHRDFFRALFELVPGATVKTGLATYRGKEHFEQTYRDTRGASGTSGGFIGFVGHEVCDCEDDE